MARVSAERRAIAAEYARGCNDPLLADLLADLADAEARAERHMRERCAAAAADAFAQRDEMSPAEIAAVIRAVPLSETLTATRRGKDGDHG